VTSEIMKRIIRKQQHTAKTGVATEQTNSTAERTDKNRAEQNVLFKVCCVFNDADSC
jgi:hypothetical protein